MNRVADTPWRPLAPPLSLATPAARRLTPHLRANATSRDPCPCPQGTHLITCCEDLAVRLYDAKTLKSDRLLTRFQSPIRAAAFNVTGSLAAVAGDEMVIKLIAFSDTSCRELRGHDGPVRSLAFDPEGDYLASASDDGTVKIWNIKSATVEHAMTVLEETRGGYT